MNGTNPVKANSMTQARVWASACRSFVKCVAINTGLGFNLWVKEESIDYVPVSEEKATSAQVETIKELCEKHKISLNAWCGCNGKTVKNLSVEILA